MKRVLVLLLILCAPLAAQAATRVEPPVAAMSFPDDIELVDFPMMSGPLSAANMADMGLKPMRLPYSIEVWNYSAKIGGFVLQTLYQGTVVLVDEQGEIRYLASCGNRIVPKETELTVFDGHWVPWPSAPLQVVPQKSRLQRFGESLMESGKDLLAVSGGLAAFGTGLLLPLGLFALMLVAIWNAFKKRPVPTQPAADSAPPSTTKKK
ncbi:MAG: hypothetical protein KBD16_00985 [Candidatus Pacebacteria bacterium]|nr:hypothetical protein [Candidatus Paceibacterota bacterium]